MPSILKKFDPPYTRAETPTQHDTNALAHNGLVYVGGAGTVKVTTVYGDTVSFVGVAAGTLLPVPVKQVWSTGTTATNLLVLGNWAPA